MNTLALAPDDPCIRHRVLPRLLNISLGYLYVKECYLCVNHPFNNSMLMLLNKLCKHFLNLGIYILNGKTYLKN